MLYISKIATVCEDLCQTCSVRSLWLAVGVYVIFTSFFQQLFFILFCFTIGKEMLKNAILRLIFFKYVLHKNILKKLNFSLK